MSDCFKQPVLVCYPVFVAEIVGVKDEDKEKGGLKLKGWVGKGDFYRSVPRGQGYIEALKRGNVFTALMPRRHQTFEASKVYKTGALAELIHAYKNNNQT